MSLMKHDNLVTAFLGVDKALDELRAEVRVLRAENLMLKSSSRDKGVLATAWAMVCQQTGIIHGIRQVPILYREKGEAERAIRDSGDRCDVAVQVEIMAVSPKKPGKKS